MREKILNALKTKYAGVDAKTLERVADKLGKTVTTEDAVQTAVDGVTVQQLMESYGDARANEAQASAVKNYEKQYGLKDGKAIQKPEPPKPEPPKPDKPQESEDIKALRQMVETMQKRLDAQDKEKTVTSRRAKLDALLKDAPDAIKSIYNGTFENMTFADDTAFQTWLDGSKTNIETLANTLKAKGGVSTPPAGGGNAGSKSVINDLVKERAAKIGKLQPSAIVGVQNAEPATGNNK